MDIFFENRAHAGRLLADRLGQYADRREVIVLALPRGGVPVGYEVARALQAPLDVLVVRKLGMPGHEELALGAIATGGVRVLDPEVVGWLPLRVIDEVTARERQELERRELAYRGRTGQPPDVSGKVVLLVDDGVATGSTMQAAVTLLRSLAPARIVVAVPVISQVAHARLSRLAEEVVAVKVSENLQSVGQFYSNFSQTSDAEVTQLLLEATAVGVGEIY